MKKTKSTYPFLLWFSESAKKQIEGCLLSGNHEGSSASYQPWLVLDLKLWSHFSICSVPQMTFHLPQRHTLTWSLICFRETLSVFFLKTTPATHGGAQLCPLSGGGQTSPPRCPIASVWLQVPEASQRALSGPEMLLSLLTLADRWNLGVVWNWLHWSFLWIDLQTHEKCSQYK